MFAVRTFSPVTLGFIERAERLTDTDGNAVLSLRLEVSTTDGTDGIGTFATEADWKAHLSDTRRRPVGMGSTRTYDAATVSRMCAASGIDGAALVAVLASGSTEVESDETAAAIESALVALESRLPDGIALGRAPRVAAPTARKVLRVKAPEPTKKATKAQEPTK